MHCFRNHGVLVVVLTCIFLWSASLVLYLQCMDQGNMAEWSKAPESGLISFVIGRTGSNLVRKGEGSNPSVVIKVFFPAFSLESSVFTLLQP